MEDVTMRNVLEKPREDGIQSTCGVAGHFLIITATELKNTGTNTEKACRFVDDFFCLLIFCSLKALS